MHALAGGSDGRGLATTRLLLPGESPYRLCLSAVAAHESTVGFWEMCLHTVKRMFCITRYAWTYALRRHNKRRHMRDVWITLYNPTSLLGFYDDEWGRADRGGVVGTRSAEVPLLHRKCLLFIMMYIFALAWKWDNYDLWADRFPPPRLYSCIPAQPFHLSSWDCFMKNKINLKNPHMI